jgi:hypothetical protein
LSDTNVVLRCFSFSMNDNFVDEIDGSSVASSAEFIARTAKDVTIDDEAVKVLKHVLAAKVAAQPPWSSHALNPKTQDEVRYIRCVVVLPFL